MTKNESVKYHAFLLRLWREEVAGVWRASLENPQTGERHGFADLNLLCSFLYDQIKLDDLEDELNDEK